MAKPGKVSAPSSKRVRRFASDGAAPRISAAEFIAWQATLGLSNGDAARALHVSPNTVTAARRDGAGADLALRCNAVLAGISAADSPDHCRLLGRINKALKA